MMLSNFWATFLKLLRWAGREKAERAWVQIFSAWCFNFILAKPNWLWDAEVQIRKETESGLFDADNYIDIEQDKDKDDDNDKWHTTIYNVMIDITATFVNMLTFQIIENLKSWQ